jgi:tol-pal system protein YbgF
MKKTALLMLCASFGIYTEAGAQSVNNSGYAGNANYAQQAAGASDGAIYEMLGRLEQLQSEVQQLRGIVEEQSQTIAELQRKQGNMYSDLDERIQLLSSTNQSAAATVPAAATDTAQAAPAAVVATPAPAAQAATAAAEPVVESKPAETAVSAAPKASEKERYQAAYDTLRNGHNAQAISMFEALQSDFPAGEYGDNAQYWLGEAYKINREYDKARTAFNKVVSQYPNSPKVPDSLLKLGYIEFD